MLRTITTMQSESAAGDKDLQTILIDKNTPVKLDEDSQREYYETFFPTSRNHKEGFGGLKNFLADIYMLSANINAVFALSRTLLSKGAELEDLSDEERKITVSKLIALIQTGLGNINHESTDNFRINGLSGSETVITKSKRYKGGYDVLLHGQPAKSGCVLVPSVNASIISDKTLAAYESEQLSNYATELSLSVVKACKEILRDLFGSSYNIDNAHTRHTVQLPLSYNFERLNTVFEQITGYKINFFRNLDAKYETLYGKFFQVDLLIDPSNALYYPWRRHVVNGFPEKPDNKELLSEEALYAGVRISTTMAINLPKNIVAYIGQDANVSRPYYSLYVVFSKWLTQALRPKGARIAGEAKGRRVVFRLPKVVLPMKSIKEMNEARKQSGLHVGKTRTNADGICISPHGTISYLPGSDIIDYETASNFERDYDRLFEAAGEAGAPVVLVNTTLGSDMYAIWNNNTALDAEIQEHKKQVGLYSGALLALDWSYNTQIHLQGDSLTFNDLNGAVEPDDLIIADMLGFDFKDEGEKSQAKTFDGFLADMGYNNDKTTTTNSEDVERILTYVGGTNAAPNFGAAALFTSIRFRRLFDTYSYFSQGENAGLPPIETLIGTTLREMGITNFSDSELDRGIYSTFMQDNGGIKAGIVNGMQGLVESGHVVLAALICALRDAQGNSGTNLFQQVGEEVGYDNAAVEVKASPAYFSLDSEVKLADFGNVYSYFGGRLFKNMCAAITQLDKKALLFPKRSLADEKFKLLPSFVNISRDILPLAVIFSKYVPNYLEYFEKAEAIYERNLPDPSIEVDDIKVPGISSKAMFFPHQIKAHKSLRKRPKYAVLDVHPGGGKTIIGLTDIMCIEQELQGGYFRPVVIAPDKLCRNWCEDAIKITEGRWNLIPVTSETMAEWGPERLTELINGSPRNTIIVTGNNFLKTRSFNVFIGPRQIKVLGGVEFIKQFNPNYVILDESHKAAKFDPKGNNVSQIHNAIKSIYTMDGIEYARLATGTFVHGRLTDVMGQAALFNTYAFKVPKANNAIDLNDPDGPLKMRSKLGKYASVITLKRKEWAFMLPNPIHTFIEIHLTDGNKPGNILHQEVFDAVMKKTLEELRDAVRKGGAASSDDEDSESTGGDDDSDTDAGSELDDVMDEDDELNKIGSVQMQRYLQAVEQLVTDPWGDDTFKAAAEAAGISRGDFVPAKIAAVIDRLDAHFEILDYDKERESARVVHWQKGMEPREYDVVEHEGLFYMRRALTQDQMEHLPEDERGDSLKRKKCPESLIPPNKDPDTWKIEKRGKVIIFCRYTRSVNAVYEGLPERYKKRARRFHGALGSVNEDKWQNLDAFSRDPDVDIFIANEQAISEGFNLQMGSRDIRVDTPWSPGELDQSAARIFRPDPSAAKVENGKPGDMSREVIYTDWIMTAGTTEVAKVARLMWKQVDKTKFDEKGNPRYEAINEISLDRIPMNLDMLSSRNRIEDFRDIGNDYFGARTLLANIERSEFAEMRRTTVAQMVPASPTPTPDYYRTLEQYPILSNQEISDENGWGLKRFKDWVDNTPGFADRIDELLHLCPVRTGFGTGVIVGYTINYTKDAEGNKVPDPARPISSVKVRYKSNDELVTHKTSNIFVPTNISASDLERFFNTSKPWATDAQRKRVEAAAEKEREKQEKATRKDERKRRTDKDEGQAAGRTDQRRRIRQANRDTGKPINEGVERVKRLPRVPNNVGSTVVEKVLGDGRIKIIPSVYNGFVAIHATNNDKDAVALEKYGFKKHGEFIYVDFKSYKQLEPFLDWVESKFELDRATEKRIETVFDVFEDTGRMGFNVRLAAKVQSELPDFFRTRMRESKDRKSLKIYPIVLHDRVRFVIDVATNMASSKLIGKTIPGAGAGGVWKLHPGMHIFFAVNKRSALSKIKELTKEGFTVTNEKSATEAINKLILTKSK